MSIGKDKQKSYLIRNKNDKNLINFIESFPDQASCRKKFKDIHDKVGVMRRKFGGKHYWQATIGQYQCKAYKIRTKLQSGTVMQVSKLLFRFCLLQYIYLQEQRKHFRHSNYKDSSDTSSLNLFGLCYKS
jgi:hypothetical protein